MLLDVNGNAVEFNVACRELFGVDLAGCMGRSWSYILEELGRCSEGESASDRSSDPAKPAGVESVSGRAIGDLTASTVTFQYRGDKSDRVALNACVLPAIAAASGERAGSIVQFQILDRLHAREFDQALRTRWRHELMWEVYAASYDRLLPELPFYREVVERHCQAFSAKRLQNILDLGGGTGNVAIRLLKQGKDVTVVDTAYAMLEKLRRKVDETIGGELTVIEESAEKLPQLKSESFDGVTVLLAFYDMQNPANALTEAIRLLKPGGKVVLTDPRECFDVEQLMAEAERVFREEGLYDGIRDDWQRIQTVKVILDETIKRIQNPANAGLSRRNRSHPDHINLVFPQTA